MTFWTAGLATAAIALLVVAHTIYAQYGPPLATWHTYVPVELAASALDRIEWQDYLRAENRIFESVDKNVSDKLRANERVPSNRYYRESPLYPGRFAINWNRSYVLEPTGTPLGAVVLLHGLTDSPYSLRHIARRYRDRGWIAVGIRLPGHGTVPGALTAVEWQDWMAATRLAIREARRRIGASKPLHLVGYSNGGALAVKYSLDALEQPGLTRPDCIVLISPMIGVTSFARFAGVLGWPAVFPAFEEAAWLSVVPEFNPFKYNSFPTNAARQSSLLSRELQQEIATLAEKGRLTQLPPILTFQSAVDSTVSAPAVVTALYAKLPANGSELVLFDVNRDARVNPLLGAGADVAIDRMVPAAPRSYGTTFIVNDSTDVEQVVARVTPALATQEHSEALGLVYPRELYSLSHVALPFPVTDALYGMQPSPDETFGVQLGTLTPRGETGVLLVDLETVIRASSNPFFPYMLRRIDEEIDANQRPRLSAAP